MNQRDEIIAAIRLLAGNTGLYPRERAEALKKIKAEVERQLEWMMAEPGGEAGSATRKG